MISWVSNSSSPPSYFCFLTKSWPSPNLFPLFRLGSLGSLHSRRQATGAVVGQLRNIEVMEPLVTRDCKGSFAVNSKLPFPMRVRAYAVLAAVV